MYLPNVENLKLTWIRIPIAILSLMTLAIGFDAVVAQNDTVWSAEYYNNRYLSGSPVLTRQDTAIAYNWGTTAPWPELNADNFSIRWASDPYFPAGTYRFYILADDNVALRVDFPFHPQIDTFNTPAVGQILSADIDLNTGVHHIQIDYRENTGNAYVYVTWVNVATNPTGPNFQVPQPPVVVNGAWTAQYYANAGLVGSPTLMISETTPSHIWGEASPSINIPVDNFSARWTSVQTLNTGNYQLTVRADDGIRVYIDGHAYIDEWHSATGTSYTTAVGLLSGQHYFQVDYYEARGSAFLDYRFQQVSISTPPIQSPNTVTTGSVVTAVRLNVRSGPSANNNVLVKINLNESYPVIGRNADSSWWQINVNGTIGWVYWRFFDVNDPQAVPIITATTSPSLNQPPTTGYFVSTLATVNVRNTPGSNGAILGQIARGNQVPVIGRNSTNTWWQVNYDQITGWVSSRFAPLQPSALITNIPVTG